MSDRIHATHLIDEPPLLVYPSLAVILGLNHAIIFQQLHFLLGVTEKAKNHYNFVDGRWWVYNSYREWREGYFPWLSEAHIKKCFLALEGLDLVDTMQSVKNRADRRKWYSINYEAWEQFTLTIGAKSSDGTSEQKAPMVGAKSSDDSSETTSETTSESPSPANGRKRDIMMDVICWVWGIKPGSYAGLLKNFLLGKAKEGTEYAAFLIEPAMHPVELAAYRHWRMDTERVIPTKPETIQRTVLEFRSLTNYEAYLERGRNTSFVVEPAASDESESDEPSDFMQTEGLVEEAEALMSQLVEKTRA